MRPTIGSRVIRKPALLMDTVRAVNVRNRIGWHGRGIEATGGAELGQDSAVTGRLSARTHSPQLFELPFKRFKSRNPRGHVSDVLIEQVVDLSTILGR